jgi:hypothetical protein
MPSPSATLLERVLFVTVSTLSVSGSRALRDPLKMPAAEPIGPA